MIFYINLAIFAWFWVVSVVFCLLAIRWSVLGGRGRFVPGVILSILALIISVLGSTHFHLTWSAWANGKPQYSYDTRWFFVGSLMLAAFVLAWALIQGNRRKGKNEGV